MNCRTWLVALLVFLVSVLPAAAQNFSQTVQTGDDTETKAAIYYLTIFQDSQYCMKARGGGTSDKPLGVYRDGDGGKNYDFHSKEYLELNPAIKGRWAYQFHNWLEEKGSGYQNYGPYLTAWQRKHSDPASAAISGEGSGHDAAMAGTYVTYEEAALEADVFFREYPRDENHYHKLGAFWADWFKNDAILDAINLFSLYQSNQINEKSPSDSANLLGVGLWTNTTLERYRNRVGEEGKLIGGKPVKPFSLQVVPQQSIRAAEPVHVIPPKETPLPLPSPGGIWKNPDAPNPFTTNPQLPITPEIPKETPLPLPSPGGLWKPQDGRPPSPFAPSTQLPDSSKDSSFPQPSNTRLPYRAPFQADGTGMKNLDYLLKKTEPQQ